ncbi:MAG: T9SS type A sorting domain-containing protein [Candidatus Marinimicrobia bacterium]|nr:T9SS type A sorting domain-containing protein [Candidatus Neomarinimicrobiota bacterium]
MNSGNHDGATEPGAQARLAFKDVIRIPGASWLRLVFNSYHLADLYTPPVSNLDSVDISADPTSSYILMTSLEDGATQRLDATSISQWRNSSAFFNGEAIEIELHVAPGDRGIFFETKEVMAGIPQVQTDARMSKSTAIQEICGTDDRVPSTDAAIGRTVQVVSGDSLAWCTGWIASNGAHLTAGHCAQPTSDLVVLEFNVRASDADGTPNFSHPDSQYSVIASSIVSDDDVGFNHFGKDWAVFDCYSNSNTGLLPVEAQLAFYRMSIDSDPSTLRITGYGDAAGSLNKTQQTATASAVADDENYDSANDVYWILQVDVKDGVSGGPIIVNGTNLTIGVLTDGACQTFDHFQNYGTGFENNEFEAAIQNFPGANITYADAGHDIATEDGTVFRPYDTIGEAVSAAAAGETISVVTGYYNEAVTISKAITFHIPVGGITIGASGPSASVQQFADAEAEEVEETDPALPSVYALHNAYPNPFNPTATIRYDLPEPAEVRLVIYNLLGREVVRLAEGHMAPGYHAALWHGRDATGRPVPSGLYIARLVTPKYVKSIKMILLK